MPVVFQAVLVGTEGRYRDDRRISGEGEYELRSEAFAMDELRRGARSSFRAELFRGRVGKEGVAIAQRIAVQVERLVYGKSGSLAPEIAGRRPWIFLFGSRNEMFALFLEPVAERRLLAVRVRRGPLTEDEASALRSGALATLLGESGSSLRARVRPGRDAYQLDLEVLADLTPR